MTHGATAPPILATLAVAVFAALLPVAAHASGLEAYRWNNRVLIIRVERFDQVALARQKAQLRADTKGLDARDLVVFAVTADAVTAIHGDAPSAPPNLRAVRQRPARGFQAVLIGKDGGVKAKWQEPVSLNRLYAVIDAMPMRQREMRQRGE